jgi:hypothetical protein
LVEPLYVVVDCSGQSFFFFRQQFPRDGAPIESKTGSETWKKKKNVGAKKVKKEN